MAFDSTRAIELLRAGTQNTQAQFRDGQREAIVHIVENRGRLLVVQRTGWGKSSVYFIAVKLLREEGHGPAILISPLLALMRNQIAAAERMGVRALTIHSGNQNEWAEVERALEADEVDVLLIYPERLANPRFTEVLQGFAGRVSLLVVDEAHCISDWGHDFRPDYRRIDRMIGNLPANLRVLATTATANNRVIEDLRTVLGDALAISRGDLTRRSLRLQTIRLAGQAERMAWLATHLPNLTGSGIIYTLTVRDSELVAAWLQDQGIEAAAYNGQSDDRPELEDRLLKNDLKVLVATTALGMGFDKPVLAFVVHFQSPASVVAYYQQVGRAGRNLPMAHGILLSGEEETAINDFFIETAFPEPAEVEQVTEALSQAADGLTEVELQRHLNISGGRIRHALKLLALESPAPVVKDSGRWQLTAADVPGEFWARVDRQTNLRRVEQAQMVEYVNLNEGHMEFLIDALDGDLSSLIEPPGEDLPPDPDPLLTNAALAFLKRTDQPLEPRKRWPNGGGLPNMGLTGAIPEVSRLQPGRILSVWRDAGWGTMVRDGKYEHNRFSDELVNACVDLFRAWKPEPNPDWVACIPSLRRPNLVPDFARRLAAALGLPCVEVLKMKQQRDEQKTKRNLMQQAQNVDDVMEVSTEVPMPSGPVLLIDDVVDSRWTLTIAGYLLQEAGSGPVFPLALASSAGSDS